MRIYENQELHVNQVVQLNEENTHRILNVMRLKKDEVLILFNGQGGEYAGYISQLEKKRVSVTLTEFSSENRSSPLKIHVFQGMARGEKMDWVVQKAAELGAFSITPVQTWHGNMRLTAAQSEKKEKQWQTIAIHACEQCGRNEIPKVHSPLELLKQLPKMQTGELGLILHPCEQSGISIKECLQDFQHKSILRDVFILIGAEGGFHETEIRHATELGWYQVTLGHRILRTETAALAAVSALQTLAGDF